MIAVDPDTEGDATSMYLAHLIVPLEISVTRIAHGITAGTEIEHANANTYVKQWPIVSLSNSILGLDVHRGLKPRRSQCSVTVGFIFWVVPRVYLMHQVILFLNEPLNP